MRGSDDLAGRTPAQNLSVLDGIPVEEAQKVLDACGGDEPAAAMACRMGRVFEVSPVVVVDMIQQIAWNTPVPLEVTPAGAEAVERLTRPEVPASPPEGGSTRKYQKKLDKASETFGDAVQSLQSAMRTGVSSGPLILERLEYLQRLIVNLNSMVAQHNLPEGGRR